MSQPHFVVHIGPMKTASTYLQKCIFDNLDALQNHGIYFPRELGQPGNMHVHHPLKLAMHDAALYDDAKRILAHARAQGCARIFLTTEALPLLTPGGIEKLRTLLDSDHVTIVYVARRWSDRLPSLWFNKIQSGGARTLPDFIRTLLGGRKPSFEVDYAVVWKNWTDAFGRDALRIMPSSNIVDDGDDIYQRFCTDVLGLEQPPVPPRLGVRMNRSGSAMDAEFTRTLNAISAERGLDTKRAMFNGYWSMRSDDALGPVYGAMKAHQDIHVLDDRDPAWDSMYERMQGYADRLTSQHGGGTVFTRQRREFPVINTDYLAQDGVAQRLHAIHDTIMTAARV